MPPGRLDVTVLGAHDLKNTQTFGRQDPFFVVRVGNKHFTSGVAHDAGKHPTWNARYSFDVTTEDRIFFTIRNRNVIAADALLGEAEINLAKVYAEGKHDATTQVVTGSGKVKGTLSVILLFTPYDTGAGKASKAGKQQQQLQPQAQLYGAPQPPPMAMGQQPQLYQTQVPTAPYSGYSQSPPPSAPPMFHPQQPSAGYGEKHSAPQMSVGYPTGQQPPPSVPACPQPPAGYPTGHGFPPPPPNYPSSPPLAPRYGTMYNQPHGYTGQYGVPPSGYPQPPMQPSGYGRGYGSAVPAPTGMYYSHHQKNKKKGKKGKKGKKWYK